MEECFKCGVTFAKARLYDAISDEGIVKVCERCSNEENIPIIKRPTTLQLKEAERKQSVYERLSAVKGGHVSKETPQNRNSQEEVTLREIVDRNYAERVPVQSKPRPELIDNFHWVLMRARRMKKLTQQQLAKELSESEAAIKMAEQGVLPEDDYKLVNKLETFLGVKIIRDEFSKEIRPKRPRWLSFDMQENKELTLSDIKEIELRKKAKEAEEIEAEDEPDEEFENETGDKNNSEDDEISQEEMDRIIFGR